MAEEKKKEYTLKEGAKHSVLEQDPARKRGTRRVFKEGGDTVLLSRAGAHALRDKLVEMDKPKPTKKKKAAPRRKKKEAAAAAS